MSEPPGQDPPHEEPTPDERPLFLHPTWMVGVVVVFAVAALVAGLRQPVWWLIGSPFIAVLVIVLWVRLRG